MSVALVGAPHGGLKDNYYSQDRNGVEALLRAIGIQHFLETCGTTGWRNCIAAIRDADPTSVKKLCPGMQDEDVGTMALNNTENFPALSKLRPDVPMGSIPGNRIPQLYRFITDLYFPDVLCEYVENLTFDKVIDALKLKKSVQICTKNPGHYMAAVDYDANIDCIIVNDPWSGRYPDGSGFNKPFHRADLSPNLQPFGNLYSKK